MSILPIGTFSSDSKEFLAPSTQRFLSLHHATHQIWIWIVHIITTRPTTRNMHRMVIRINILRTSHLCHLPSRSSVLRLLFWCFIMIISIQLSVSSPCNRLFKIGNQHVRIIWHNQYFIVSGIITTVKECIE